MNIYDYITLGVAILSIIVSVMLTYYSIKSSNQSTRLMAKVMRENSRTTTSEHLSLYRIEAFYNAVAIKNLEFDIKQIERQIEKCTAEEKAPLEEKLKKLQMNHHFMKVREAKLLQNDFKLQKELSILFEEYKA